MIDPDFLEGVMSRRNFQCTYSKLKSEMACDKESKRQQPLEYYPDNPHLKKEKPMALIQTVEPEKMDQAC